MLEVTVKVWGNHAVSPEEEKERLQWEGFAEKEPTPIFISSFTVDNTTYCPSLALLALYAEQGL